MIIFYEPPPNKIGNLLLFIKLITLYLALKTKIEMLQMKENVVALMSEPINFDLQWPCFF